MELLTAMCSHVPNQGEQIKAYMLAKSKVGKLLRREIRDEERRRTEA